MASERNRTVEAEERQREYELLRASVPVVAPTRPPLGHEGVERLGRAFDGLGDEVLRALDSGRS